MTVQRIHCCTKSINTLRIVTMTLFTIIEYTLIILAFFASLLMAKREGFQAKNIILVLTLFMVASVNSIHAFPFLNTEWIVRNKFVIVSVGMLLEVGCYLLLYASLLRGRRYRLFTFLYFLSFVVFSVVASVNVQQLNTGYPTYSFIFGSFGVLICIMIFFYEKLQEKFSYRVFKNFWFLISVGLFIFLTIEIPFMSLLNYYMRMELELPTGVMAVYYAKLGISLLYYLTYLIGIRWKIRT